MLTVFGLPQRMSLWETAIYKFTKGRRTKRPLSRYQAGADEGSTFRWNNVCNLRVFEKTIEFDIMFATIIANQTKL